MYMHLPGRQSKETPLNIKLQRPLKVKVWKDECLFMWNGRDRKQSLLCDAGLGCEMTPTVMLRLQEEK